MGLKFDIRNSNPWYLKIIPDIKISFSFIRKSIYVITTYGISYTRQSFPRVCVCVCLCVCLCVSELPYKQMFNVKCIWKLLTIHGMGETLWYF